jgi:hypothetical protein
MSRLQFDSRRGGRRRGEGTRLSSSALAVFPVNCELPHIGAAKNMRPPLRQAQRDAEGKQMRAWMVGMAVVVAIGLIWSVAAMSKLVPVASADMASAAISPHAE